MENNTNKVQEINTLEEGYYLNNFISLINFVNEKYHDLLKDSELNFIEEFKSLSIGAQRLYVRLITRKGPYFREDKLNYKEISNIKLCLDELCNASFFVKNAKHDLEFALQVITKPELLLFVKEINLTLSKDNLLNKGSVLDFLLDQDHEAIWGHLIQRYTFYFPIYFETVLLFKLLFFGNTFQDLPEFILEDIGILRFESYKIRKKDRLFSERKVLDDILIISQLRAELWVGIQSNDLEAVIQIGKILKGFDCHKKVVGKLEKSYTQIGRFLEKFKLWEQAISFYDLSTYPPAIERKTRVLEKLGNYKGALNLTDIIIASSTNEEEIEFAMKFSEGLKKKLNLPYKKRQKEVFNKENLVLDRKRDIRVEELCLNHYIQTGWEGFYTENGIWKGLFGLTFWDIIFMSVPEVFFNPYQRGPVDLFSDQFSIRRKQVIKKRFKEIQKINWQSKIIETYDTKFNTANMLVQWNKLSKEQLLIVLETVPGNDIIRIFERMINNLKDFKTGFPDLMIYNKLKSEYCLVEVKGPGDQLRQNQKRWLRYFEKHSIPFKIANVKWT